MQNSVAHELQMSQSLLAKITEEKRQLEIQVLSSPPPLPSLPGFLAPVRLHGCTAGPEPRGLKEIDRKQVQQKHAELCSALSEITVVESKLAQVSSRVAGLPGSGHAKRDSAPPPRPPPRPTSSAAPGDGPEHAQRSQGGGEGSPGRSRGGGVGRGAADGVEEVRLEHLVRDVAKAQLALQRLQSSFSSEQEELFSDPEAALHHHQQDPRRVMCEGAHALCACARAHARTHTHSFNLSIQPLDTCAPWRGSSRATTITLQVRCTT